MVDLTPFKIASQPGCKRDGTMLEGDNYVDNQWCRYQLKKGLPRKMGGFKRLTNEMSGISRGLAVFNNNTSTYVHSGYSGGLEQCILDSNGIASIWKGRTPAGFAPDPNNLWQFDTLYDGTATNTSLLAHCGTNLADITSDAQFPVYYGDVLDTAALVATGSPPVSGGVFSLGPFGVSYDSNGLVNYTAPNDLVTAWSTARPTSAKLVYGAPIRAGAGNGPSGLIWGVEALVRMTFVGGSAIWNFDNITSAYSLLSSQAIVEYDGIFYWPGIDHFQSFNGVVQELDNGMNLNWFYDNLNFAASQKVFTMKVPRWGEIWWCYPRGNSTECTHAVIYNVRLSKLLGYAVWYDTQLPGGGRSAAQFARVFRRPLMSGVDVMTGRYLLWEHEYQTDQIDGTKVEAIQSYFETNATWPVEFGGGPSNKSLYVDYIEPDFVQTGDLSISVTGSPSNARAPEESSTPVFFPDTATSADNQIVYLREQRRQMRFRIESNVVGGDYQMGDTVAQVRPGDVRITS